MARVRRAACAPRDRPEASRVTRAIPELPVVLMLLALELLLVVPFGAIGIQLITGATTT